MTIGAGVLSIGSNAFGDKPTKVIWLTNTPPDGYAQAAGTVNYVANNLYTSLNNKTVYPYLSSMFEVGGVKYVPVSPSERTCDAIDCLYDASAENINIDQTVSYRGINMTVNEVKPYTCYQNNKIKNMDVRFGGNFGSYAFYGCTNLKNVSMGDGVTTIGNWAFSGCAALDNFSFGSSMETIGKEAFSDCTAMTKLVSRSATPPVCNTNALDDINKWNCTLTIPQGTLAQYQAADQWKEFFFIEEKDLSSVNNITMDDGSKQQIVATYDLNGRRTTGLQRGMNIVKMKNGDTKKVVVK